MAGDEVSKHTGWKAHFDTLTTRGRMNCTLASFAFYFSLYIGYKMYSNKKQQ